MKSALRVLSALMIAMTAAAAVRAAQPPSTSKEPAAAVKADADAKTDAADRSLREQDIYIPYEKLRQVFEKHGRGVFLPYEKFDELWRAAQDKTRPAAEPRPPVGAIITEIQNEATVAKDVVEVRAELKIDLLSEGWHEVPLRLSDAALIRATLNGQPARILGGVNEDHRLLVEKKGKQPEQIVLSLEYATAINRMPGQNSVLFQVPQAPVSRWRVRIPQAGVKVNVQPLIAATEVPPGTPAAEPKPGGAKPTKPADETVILAFVGASPTVRIDWTPKSEGATGLAAVASVQAEQQVWIQEGVTRSRTNLVYTISRAELAQLAIGVPDDYKVVNVFDPNVRQWSVEPAPGEPGTQRIVASLFEPAKASQQVTVELEKIAGQKRAASLKTPVVSLKAPVVRALGVGRQQGFVVVHVGGGLRAEAARTSGLLQVDCTELPLAIRTGGWAFSYRYVTVPFELELNVEQVEPRITVDSLVEARLQPERLSLDLTAIYTIERAGVFKLELDVPEGFDVRQVHGRSIPAVGSPVPGASKIFRAATQGAVAAEVESYHLEGAKKNHLVVNLARKAMGCVALAVQLERDLQEPNLLTPTGKAADIALPAPQVTPGTVERAVGRLVIHAPESLQVNFGKLQGLRSVSIDEALDGMPWAAGPRQPPGAKADLRPVLAFTFTQEPISLRLAAERRRPQVTIRQLVVGRIEEGVVKYQFTFFYTIQYSGVKSLRIDVPTEVAAKLHNTTPRITERTIDPPPADLAKGMIAWSLASDSELLGDGRIDLTWEQKIAEKLEVGKPIALSVPRLTPRDVDRAWGQIVLAKAETLDIDESDRQEGLRPIDPQHDLMAEVPGAARAFEFHGDWKLPLSITRYELEEVKRTSIDRAVVRMVVTPAGELAVQALYRIRSARQRLSITLPEGAAFDTEPLRINSQPTVLGRGLSGEFIVPLGAAGPDESTLMELRYTVAGGSHRLELPMFPEDPAVQKVYLCAFVPQTRALLGTTGPWTEQFKWWLGPGLNWIARNDADDRQLVARVCEGTKHSGAEADSFHTDGTLYVFSTLRPAADGALGIRTVDRTALNAAIFVLILLGGLSLAWAGLFARVLAAGSLLVVLVLAGVFAPTFSLRLLSGPLLGAVFIVLVIWGVLFVFRLRTVPIALGQAIAARWAARKPLPKPSAVTPPPGSEPSKGGPSHE